MEELLHGGPPPWRIPPWDSRGTEGRHYAWKAPYLERSDFSSFVVEPLWNSRGTVVLARSAGPGGSGGAEPPSLISKNKT